MDNFPIFLIIALCIAAYRIYKIRDRFKNLTRSEWLRYIVGFLLAFAVACIVIMGGIYVIKLFWDGFLYIISSFIIVCIGLLLGSLVFKPFIPTALKSFYDR